MDGTFELNKPGWYEVKHAEPNEFLNSKLENDTYGIYYSVAFQGDASTFLWQAKTAPESGKKYWGHIEQTKSGKSMRFKKDKEPENVPAQAASNFESVDKQDSINRAVALNNAVALYAGILEMNDVDPKTEDLLLATADKFLTWLKNEPSETPGRDKARKVADKLKANQEDEEEPEWMKGLEE